MVVDSGFTAMNKDGMGHLQEEEGEGCAEFPIQRGREYARAPEGSNIL